MIKAFCAKCANVCNDTSYPAFSNKKKQFGLPFTFFIFKKIDFNNARQSARAFFIRHINLIYLIFALKESSDGKLFNMSSGQIVR